MKRKLRYGVLAAAAVMAGSAAVSTGVQAGGNHHPAAAEGATIEVVTHGQASDPFWSVFKRGVDDAAAQMGVSVNYSAPATFDMVAMSQLIDAAVAKNPDGLVVSVPDYDALKDSLAAAHDAGIPIITVNSGSDVYQEIGAITHVGQDETIAGEAAGQHLADAGATHVMCINQEVGNAGLDARCAGAKTSIEAAGGTLDVVQVDLNDAAGAQSTISSALQADDTIDAVLALGPTGALAGAGGDRGGRQDRRHPHRHVRPQPGRDPGDHRRQHAVRRRSAAVPPGLPADRVPHPVPQQPQHGRWRPARAHRSWLRHAPTTPSRSST